MGVAGVQPDSGSPGRCEEIGPPAPAPALVPGSPVNEDLGRERALVDARIGRGLCLFADGRLDTMELGHRNVGDLAVNELGISPSEGSELRSLARGMERFPLLAAAFRRGELGRSACLLLLKVTRPETEAGWLALARRSSVRKLRRTVKAWRRVEKGEHVEEDAEEFVEVSFRAPGWIGRFLRIVGKDLVERVCGQRLPLWRVVDILCAEFASEFGHLVPEEGWGRGPEPRRGLDARREGEAVALPAEAELRRAGEERGEEPQTSESAGEGDTLSLPDPREAVDAQACVAVLQELVARRQSLAWRTGRALARAYTRREHLDHGYLNFSAYVSDELGMGRRRAELLRALDGRLERVPALREAYRTARLGWNKTWTLTRICGQETAGAWIERAERLTLRGLERQVEAMEAMRELDEEEWERQTGRLPPSRPLLRKLGILPGGHRAADWEALLRAADVRTDRETQTETRREIRALFGAGPNAFRAPPEVADVFQRTLRGVRRLIGSPREGVCVAFLVHYFAVTHEREAKALMGRHATLLRDGCACVWPGCSSRKIEGHHIRFASHGGSDDPSNRTSACGRHHRAGVHGGKVRIRGTAPDALTFEIGRRVRRDEELVSGRAR